MQYLAKNISFLVQTFFGIFLLSKSLFGFFETKKEEETSRGRGRGGGTPSHVSGEGGQQVRGGRGGQLVHEGGRGQLLASRPSGRIRSAVGSDRGEGDCSRL